MPLENTQPIQTITIDKFGGVDYSTDASKVSVNRSPDLLNMISNTSNFPVKRTGYKKIGLNATVFGMHRYVTSDSVDVLLVHCGDRMYLYDETDGTFDTVLRDAETEAPMALSKSTSFMMNLNDNNTLWILDGTTYQYYDGTYLKPVASLNSDTLANVGVYIPTTLYGALPSGAKPDGAVDIDEPVNFLTGWQKNMFIADGGTRQVDVLELWQSPSANGTINVTVGGATSAISVSSGESIMSIANKIKNVRTNSCDFSVTSNTSDLVSIQFTKIVTVDNLPPTINFNSTGANGAVYTITEGKAGLWQYHLVTKPIDEGSEVRVIVDEEVKEVDINYTVDYENGIIEFIQDSTNSNIPVAKIGGVPNVEITFRKTIPNYADAINKCTISSVYGGNIDTRVFLSGNPDLPNSDFQSGLYDPTYFGDTSYTKIGSDRSRIMGYHKIFESQMIIKSDNEQDATHYLRTYQLDANNNPVFPLTQGKDSYGAIAKHSFATLGDIPLYLSKDGVIGVFSTAVKQQASMKNVSLYVNERLTKENNLYSATGYSFQDKYYLCINDNVYVADGRQYNNGQFEWYFWNNIGATCMIEFNDYLFFGKSDGLYRFFNDDEANAYHDETVVDDVLTELPIDAYWTTPFTAFEQWDRYKNVERISTVVMPYNHTGVRQSYRTNDVYLTEANTKHADLFDFNDIDFSRFSFSTIQAPTPIVKKIKVKKCYVFQLKLQNNELNEPFGMLAVTIGYRVGNQIK